MKTSKVRTLVVAALLLAAHVVLVRFCAITTPLVRISFGFLPLAICGMLYGPVWAGAVGGAGRSSGGDPLSRRALLSGLYPLHCPDRGYLRPVAAAGEGGSGPGGPGCSTGLPGGEPVSQHAVAIHHGRNPFPCPTAVPDGHINHGSHRIYTVAGHRAACPSVPVRGAASVGAKGVKNNL